MEEERIVSPKQINNDKELDITLRPKTFKEFIGQEKIKENLKIAIMASKKRKESLDHILFYGCPGLGKTTLAHIVARELNVNIKVTSGPAIEKAGDLAAILTNLKDGDILFIDEIHRLNKVIEEILYPALEEFKLDIIIGKGPSARILRLNLPKFTLIGATTRLSLLSSPLRDRFGMILHLDFYSDEEISQILKRSVKILNIKAEEKAIHEISKRSRKTPRVANRLLKRARDYCEVKADGVITAEAVLKSFELLEIDEFGLDKMDRFLLTTIIEKFNGGPVGINTLAAATAEEIETIEEIYEPFLMRIGFLERTPKGRKVTQLAYKHLGFDNNLFKKQLL